jgi:GTP-binding protein Era
MVVFDTPGLLEPKYALQEAMRSTSLVALADADVIAYIVDSTTQEVKSLVEAAGLSSPPSAPVLLVLNKIDLLSRDRVRALRNEFPDAVLVSATNGDGIDDLIAKLESKLPESPYLYPEDEISTQSVRFFVAELVRETVLEQLHDEIPYSVACGVEEFREDGSPVYIRTVIYVERASQKRIVIGANGMRIREVGRAARKKIESFLGQTVYLDLWVKVEPNWRRSTSALQRFGYHIAKGNA